MAYCAVSAKRGKNDEIAHKALHCLIQRYKVGYFDPGFPFTT